MYLSHANTRKYLRRITLTHYLMSLIMRLYISYIEMLFMNNICMNPNRGEFSVI